MMFNQYPYINYNDLNLDFIIKIIKQLENEVKNFVSLNAVKYANPIQWSITTQYEKNTIVMDGLTGTAYLSVQPVPIGVSLSNTDYWTPVFDLSAFVVRAAKNFTNNYESELSSTATMSLSVGDWLVWGDVLYRVISPITAGDSYVIGSNIERITIENIISVLDVAIANLSNKIGDLNDLSTTDKSNLVAAINEEVAARIGAIENVQEQLDSINPNKYSFTTDLPMYSVISVTGNDLSGWLQGGCVSDTYYYLFFRDPATDLTTMKVYNKDTYEFVKEFSNLSLGHANSACFANGVVYVSQTFLPGLIDARSNVLYAISESSVISNTVNPQAITLDFHFGGLGYNYDDKIFLFYDLEGDYGKIRITDENFATIRDITTAYTYNDPVSIDYYNGYYIISRYGFDDRLPSYLCGSIEVYDKDFNILKVYPLNKNYPTEVESAIIRKNDGVLLLATMEEYGAIIYESRIFLGGMIYPSETEDEYDIRENMIVNSNFIKPINTLDFSTYTGAGGENDIYLTDKWWAYVGGTSAHNATYTLTSNGLKIENGSDSTNSTAAICQMIPNECLDDGKKYTLSIDVEILSGRLLVNFGVGRWGDESARVEMLTSTSGIRTRTFSMPVGIANKDYRVMFASIPRNAGETSSCIIKSVKLERGRYSTLKYNAFQDFQRDKIICKNHVEKIVSTSAYGTIGFGHIVNGVPELLIDITNQDYYRFKDVCGGSIRISDIGANTIWTTGTLTFGSFKRVSNKYATVTLTGLANLSTHNGEEFELTANNDTNAYYGFVYDVARI